MVWLNVLLVVTHATCWVVAVMGPNTCSRSETYTVTMRVLEKKPVTIKTYTWCFKMPPRCTKFKQEVVDHYRIQSEPRTRWVTECCPGYVADEKDMYCEPVCALGCEHGTCTAPHKCSCNPGFFGPSCSQECPHGTWGPVCQLNCVCLNSASCHPQTGQCICTPGYWGSRCESICPNGTFGDHCENRCSCEDGNNICHHVTGSCNVSSSCDGSSACHTEWTPSQPEVVQQLLSSTATSEDNPIHEPLVTTVTTSDDIRPSDRVANEHVSGYDMKTPEASIPENFTIGNKGELRHSVSVTESDRSTVITEMPSTTSSSRGYTDSPMPSTTTPVHDTGLLQEANEERFIEKESHEDQLGHSRPEHGTERSYEDLHITQPVDTVSPSSEETNKDEENIRTETPQEDVIKDKVVVQGQFSDVTEINTEGPYQPEAKEAEITNYKTDEQRKKFTDQKKYRSKERTKDTSNQKTDLISTKQSDEGHIWVIPEQDYGESPKHYEQSQEGSHRDHMEKRVDTGKPKKLADQKRVKDLVDTDQLKITANQERQMGDSKNTYSDFLSSFSIAAGVSTGIIMVVGFITLMARCRRAKPKSEGVTSVEMETMANKPEDVRSSIPIDEASIPVVRPLFFSPVYLPGDVSPTEGNGGLILTAVFSRPASNIHELYRQQDLLRETLAPHYDVPPPTGTRNSVCTSIGTAETEHVYEELPCWRNQPASSQGESDC